MGVTSVRLMQRPEQSLQPSEQTQHLWLHHKTNRLYYNHLLLNLYVIHGIKAICDVVLLDVFSAIMNEKPFSALISKCNSLRKIQ